MLIMDSTNRMVAYLDNSICCLQLTSNIGYVICLGRNLSLTPVHDWIHYCIQDWTPNWDPALVKSTVWPNRFQGIIAVFSGVTAVRLCDPDPRCKDEIVNLNDGA